MGQDDELWNWIQKVLDYLNAEGMSSEESEGEEDMPSHVLRVKVVPWRRNMEAIWRMVEHAGK